MCFGVTDAAFGGLGPLLPTLLPWYWASRPKTRFLNVEILYIGQRGHCKSSGSLSFVLFKFPNHLDKMFVVNRLFGLFALDNLLCIRPDVENPIVKFDQNAF